MPFLVADPTRTLATEALLQGRHHLVEEPAETLTATFYDTFDWSVFLAGGALEWRNAPPRPVLIWSDLTGERESMTQGAPAEPGFSADLPPGPVRSAMLGVVGVRRLLPVMGIETSIRSLRLLNEDDKTIARLRIEDTRYRDPRTGREGDLAPRLHLLPVRGYEAEHAQIARLLAEEAGLQSADSRLLLEALGAAGRRPADYSSKLDYRLDPDTRADVATKEILLGLLGTLEANLEGTRANLDSEFLHDLRVATRRTRSALGQIRGVFPGDLVEHFKGEFAWLQQVTGPVRDLDVYLLDFDTYQQGLPRPLRPHLEPLRRFLLSHYAAEQRRLAETLASERFTRLIRDWRAFLRSPAVEPVTTINGARPIRAVADERIWTLVKRVRREGRAIRPDSPPEELHELRKSSKKLRYLMEFFQSLYPKEEIRGLIGLMKTLLDNLGGYQDLAVQAAHLKEIARRMREEDHAETDSLLAMGALIGNLLARQQAARDAFDAVFGGFLAEDNQASLRALFGPRPAPGRTDGGAP